MYSEQRFIFLRWEKVVKSGDAQGDITTNKLLEAI